ncbi:tyrosine-type recombinase/integrase [Nocardia farcinica]|uniref:tyrosine-type recombinase/integrase n=1 Tax=Nocardia farcinica TaxID=37329 RepID=UPI0024556D88|nr:tyrosine-type recombinase/integrase [Nocardia farcinica]
MRDENEVIDEEFVAPPLAVPIEQFLTDLANANRPANTVRAYRADLTGFAEHVDGGLRGVDVAAVRAFLSGIADLAPATRKRKRAAVAAFCRWAVRQDLLAVNPMDRVDTITVPKTLPRPATAADIAKVFAAICPRRPRKEVPVEVLRDRVLFETAYVCGARASEVCALHVEDFDLRLDDEHVRLHGKGGTVRTVLLDDRGHVAMLRLYLQRTGYSAGPSSAPASTAAAARCPTPPPTTGGSRYCAAAGVDIDIHQLRHSHATELINAGVSIEVVRKRLGHASTETTQVYALLADQVADNEIRAARRRRGL